MTLIIDYFLYIAGGSLVLLCLMWVLHLFSSNSWFCRKLNWHKEPFNHLYDGVNIRGRCPRCKQDVVKGPNGEWLHADKK